MEDSVFDAIRFVAVAPSSPFLAPFMLASVFTAVLSLYHTVRYVHYSVKQSRGENVTVTTKMRDHDIFCQPLVVLTHRFTAHLHLIDLSL